MQCLKLLAWKIGDLGFPAEKTTFFLTFPQCWTKDVGPAFYESYANDLCLLGSFPALAFTFQRYEMFLPRALVNIQYWESFIDRKVACSASDRQCSHFESCV